MPTGGESSDRRRRPVVDEAATKEYFGRRVQYYREQLGLTMDDLAGLLGKTKASVSRIESGKQNVSVAGVVELAAILGVDVEALFPPTPARRKGQQGLGEEEEGSLWNFDTTRQRQAFVAFMRTLADELEPVGAQDN